MSFTPGTAAGEGDVGHRVWQSLRWHWLPVLTAVVAATVGAVLLVDQLPDEYVAEAVLALEPADDTGADAGLIRLRAPTYVSYLLAEATHVAMADELGPGAVDDLADAGVEVIGDTGTILVTAEHERPERAVELAVALAERAEAFSAREQGLDLALIAPPVEPGSPSGPPRRLILAAVVVAATLLGLGGALLWDQVRPRLRDGEQLARITGTTALVEVPRRRGITTADPRADGRVATAGRVLRTHLDGELHLPATMSVLSAVRGEGRTSITVLLAQSLANLGFRVLMVDADLETRGLSGAHGHDGNPAMVSALLGTGNFADALHETATPDVHVLPAGADVSADALSRGIGRLLATAREVFDVVIVDTPPLLGGDLARTIAVSSEHALLVAAVGTPTGILEQTATALENLRVRPVGSVVNRGRGRRLA